MPVSIRLVELGNVREGKGPIKEEGKRKREGVDRRGGEGEKCHDM
jgi:hypothetical protein